MKAVLGLRDKANAVVGDGVGAMTAAGDAAVVPGVGAGVETAVAAGVGVGEGVGATVRAAKGDESSCGVGN